MASKGEISALPSTSGATESREFGANCHAKKTTNIATLSDSPSRHPIENFFKKIRSRSKSPATGKKALAVKQQAWTDSEIDQPDRILPPKNGHAFQSTAKEKDTKSLPPRSPSGKKLKSWLSKDSPSQDNLAKEATSTPLLKQGRFGSWMQSRFGRSPSGRKLRTPVQNALRDQDQRGALSEEDLVSKSLADEMTNSFLEARTQTPDPFPVSAPKVSPAPVMMSSYHSQDSVFDTPEKLPSYIRLSYALSGYSQYRTPTIAKSPLANGIGHNDKAVSHPSRDPGQASTTYSTPQGKSMVERRLEMFQKDFQGDDGGYSSGRKSDPKPTAPRRHEKKKGHELRLVYAAEQLPTPVRELAGNFARMNLDNNSAQSSCGDKEKKSVPTDDLVNQRTPEIGVLTNGTAEKTPWSDLVQGFEKMTVSTEETPASSKTGRPLPVPSPRRLIKESEELGTILSVSGSSAATDTYISGPLSITQDEEGSSLLDEVLKATETIMTPEVENQKSQPNAYRDTPTEANGPNSSRDPSPPAEEEEEGPHAPHATPRPQSLNNVTDAAGSWNGIDHGVKAEQLAYELNGDDGVMEDEDFSDSVGEKLRRKARYERAKLESAVEDCERDLEVVPSEEAAAYLRMAVGKCKLLLRKKFATFEGLVEKNLNPVKDDPRPTKDDDLEGYWTLVAIEIESLEESFRKISALKLSGWDIAAMSDDEDTDAKNGANKSKPSSKNGSGRSSPANQRGASMTNGNGTSTNQHKGREEARERIRAAKLAAKQRMAANQQQETESTDDAKFFVA